MKIVSYNFGFMSNHVFSAAHMWRWFNMKSTFLSIYTCLIVEFVLEVVLFLFDSSILHLKVFCKRSFVLYNIVSVGKFCVLHSDSLCFIWNWSLHINIVSSYILDQAGSYKSLFPVLFFLWPCKNATINLILLYRSCVFAHHGFATMNDIACSLI